MLTDGVIGSRIKIGAWVVAEERGTAYDGSDEADNPLQERTDITVPLLTVDVRLTEQFGVQAGATIPDITRTAVAPRPSGVVNDKERFHGLGDTSLQGWYRLRPISRWKVVLNVGASLPTGKTERPVFRPGVRGETLVPVSRLQRGSGTLDPLFGVNADRRMGRLTIFGSVAARTPVSENGDGLRTGASSEITAGAAREMGTHRFIGLVRVGWLNRQQDVFDDTPVLVGGGNWLYLTPGIAVQVGKGISAQAEVKLPMYRSLRNTQLDSPAIVQVGISRAF